MVPQDQAIRLAAALIRSRYRPNPEQALREEQGRDCPAPGESSAGRPVRENRRFRVRKAGFGARAGPETGCQPNSSISTQLLYASGDPLILGLAGDWSAESNQIGRLRMAVEKTALAE